MKTQRNCIIHFIGLLMVLVGLGGWLGRQKSLRNPGALSDSTVSVEASTLTDQVNSSTVGLYSDSVDAKPDQAATLRVSEAYGKLPLSFEANYGQTDEQVQFLSRGNGYSLFLTATEAVLSLSKPTVNKTVHKVGKTFSVPRHLEKPRATSVVRMKLAGANAAPQVSGLEELPGKSNYFSGNDPSKWRTNVPTYAKVKYNDVYPGIDLVYYGNQRQLEYDWVVAPGADPSHIRFVYEGVKQIRLDADGDLVLRTVGGEVRQRKPVIYQEENGSKQIIPGHFVRKESNQIGFEIAAYDTEKPLVIDPVLSYSTFIGGSADEQTRKIKTDISGNAYIIGYTFSPDFPTTPGAFQATGHAYVAKLNASGTALLFSTYLSGNNVENIRGIAVDSTGNAYLTGDTDSSNFPTTPGAFQTKLRGPGDIFVVKLNATGTSLIYATLIGGDSGESGNDLTVDSSGNAYVTGSVNSSNFPVTPGAFQANLGGGVDAFAVKLNTLGTALLYSTYLGGNNYESENGITVDASGNAYITGTTSSTNFPTTPSAFQTTYADKYDAFVTKLNATGTGAIFSTYFGGSKGEGSSSITVDSSNNIYVTGSTYSSDFPTTPGAFQTTYGGGANDGFIVKLNPAGSSLSYSTYLGGNGDEHVSSIAVDTAGNAYVTGQMDTPNFLTTPDALQPTISGDSDAFIVKLNPAGSMLSYSTYLGGSAWDYGTGIALDALGNVYVIGTTYSNNFPITPGAFQTTFYGGYSDAFVVKLNLGQGNLPPTIMPFTVTRQQGTAAMMASIATVSDLETPAGNLVVTASSLPLGITLTGITNTNGAITAMIGAGCNATVGTNTVVLTVTDSGGLTATASLTVNITANTPPVLGTYPNTAMQFGSGLPVIPSAAPSDNGVVVGLNASAVGLGNLPTDFATGAVVIPPNTPVGNYTVIVRVVDNCNILTTTSFSLFVLAAPTCGSYTFTNPMLYPTAANPTSVATGDFDGDGKLDLVSANYEANNVSILLNDGAGSFKPAVNFAAGTNPKYVAVGDFNGDQKLDLAVANLVSGNLSILLGDGKGAFSAPINVPGMNYPTSIAIGDFNGDQKVDLAVTNSGFYLTTIVYGNGDGTFGNLTHLYNGSFPIAVVAADFNKDGKVDLAVANNVSRTVTVFWNGGNGVFTPSSFDVGDGPIAIVASDFNGDGYQDLAVANYYENNVSVLVNDGVGGFRLPVNFAVGRFPIALATADLNGDQQPDLVVANQGADFVTVLVAQTRPANVNLATVLLTPAPVINFSTSNVVVKEDIYALALGDFNGDGNNDLALADYWVNRIIALRGGCVK